MVTGDNNNKFYDMHDNDDGTFTVQWGRVGTKGTPTTYPIGNWDKKLKSKLAKGYKDITQNIAKISEYLPVSDTELNIILNTFLENSRQYVSHFTETTAISEIAAVKAQEHVNNMVENTNIADPTSATLEDFNKELLALFEIIPRKMKNVRNDLCMNLKDRASKVTDEQSLLDNLINMSKKMPTASGQHTIEEAFGFTMAKCSDNEVDFIKNKLANDGFRKYTFNRAWAVSTLDREAGFKTYLKEKELEENDQNVKMYWHGTGTENILSILSNGLLIKPSNASCCGSAYGVGIYDAPNADKASGYTSIAGAYWKGGSSKVAYMFINAVIMGKQYDVHDNYELYGNTKIRDLTGAKFEKSNLGYNSVYAHAGSSLKRDEAIVSNQNQVACRFLVEFTC